MQAVTARRKSTFFAVMQAQAARAMGGGSDDDEDEDEDAEMYTEENMDRRYGLRHDEKISAELTAWWRVARRVIEAAGLPAEEGLRHDEYHVILGKVYKALVEDWDEEEAGKWRTTGRATLTARRRRRRAHSWTASSSSPTCGPSRPTPPSTSASCGTSSRS